MKKLLSLLVGVALVMATHSVWAQCCMGNMKGMSMPGTCNMSAAKQKVKKIRKKSAGKTAVPAAKTYVCPMDGTTSDKSGPCPKCGMDMVEQK